MIRSGFRAGTLVLAIGASVCTSCSPIVFVDRPGAGKPAAVQGTAPVSLADAAAYGLRLRDAYRHKISDQIVLENAAAGGLIAVAAAAFGLAATGGHAGALIGLGAGGAAAYVGARTYASRQQQLIYAAGAGAVICSIQGTESVRIAMADLPELKRLVEGPPGITAARDALQALVDKNGGDETQDLANARAAIANADAAYSRGLEAILTLEGSGETLLMAFRGIEGQVDRAIIDSRPDLSSLYASLATTIPTAAGQIMGRAPMQVAATVPAKAAFLQVQDQKKLRDDTDALIRQTRRITLLADRIAAALAHQPAKDCGSDIAAAGSTLVLDRTGELPVDVGGAPRQVTINASGGVPPYLARWSGLSPAAGITLRMGDRFDGTILVDVDKNAPAGTYAIAVSDGARGRAAVTLVVTNAAAPVPAAPAKPAAAAAAKAAAATPDAALQKVQRGLLDFGIARVTVDGVEKPLVADGQWGAITREAIRKYLHDIPNGIANPPSDRAALMQLVKQRGL